MIFERLYELCSFSFDFCKKKKKKKKSQKHCVHFVPFLSISTDISGKAEDAYPTGAHGPCFQFLVESELHICFCCLWVCFLLLCVLYCVCPFSMPGPWITFFCLPLCPWFPWLLFHLDIFVIALFHINYLCIYL